MLIATDLDGTIDADPALFQHLFSVLRAAGDEVAILTGWHGDIDQTAIAAKQDYALQLGFTAYDQLVVFPDVGSLPQLKAKWCFDHGVALLIDNDRANAQASQDHCMVLVPWATRVGKKKDGWR